MEALPPHTDTLKDILLLYIFWSVILSFCRNQDLGKINLIRVNTILQRKTMVVVRPHNKYNKNVVYDRFVFLCNIFYTPLSQILISYISFN